MPDHQHVAAASDVIDEIIGSGAFGGSHHYGEPHQTRENRHDHFHGKTSFTNGVVRTMKSL